MSRDDNTPDTDQELDQQMERLAQQLTDDKVNAIAERLGLRRHEAAARDPVTRDPSIRAPSTRDPGTHGTGPGISNNENAHCSFCGGSREFVGIMVESKKGALICRGCIATMVAGKLS